MKLHTGRIYAVPCIELGSYVAVTSPGFRAVDN